MSVVLSVLFWLLMVALGLIALVVLMPLHLEGRGWVEDGDAAGRAQARWGWWIVMFRADSETGVDLRLFGLRIWRAGREKAAPDDPEMAARKAEKAAEKKARKTERAARKAKKKSDRPRRPFMTRVLHGLRTSRALWRTAGTLWRALSVRGHLYGAIGMSDPSDTAALFGALEPIARRSRAVDLDLEPDWIDATLAVDGAIRVRVWPIHILLALLWLIVRDGPTRRGMWALVCARR